MSGEKYTFSMAGILEGLNDSQAKAVTATDRHLLVVAGPGTGKTLTIVRRIAYLIEQGVEPSRILAVTFTNRAAREMRERIHAFLGKRAESLFIGTFHLLGLKIMRESLEDDIVICTREEQIDLLKQISGHSARSARQMAEKISRVKNCVEEPDRETRELCDLYNSALRKNGSYDFEDLIGVPSDLFDAGRISDTYRERFTHVIVDEYQDISPAQYRLLKCLMTNGSTLCAVGDSDQAIYAFRGADVQNFLNFRNDFPDADVVVLKENYRSTGIVITAAQSLIQNNRKRIEKELKSLREEGRPITVISVPDDKGEADSVVQQIEARIGGTSHYRMMNASVSKDFSDASYGFSDFAVLFRTKAQATLFEEAFREWGIPCQVVGDRNSFNRKALIDRLRACKEALPEAVDLAGLMKKVCEEAGLAGSDQCLLENLALSYTDRPLQEAIGEITNELSLLTTVDAFDPRADAVALMTLHMAKGLEFKVVFIAGVEDGLIPFAPAKEETDVEEERRLFYVGMTRAKDELFLLNARSRFLYGRRLVCSPSPFLSEIPEGLICTEVVPEGPKKLKKPEQMGLF